MKCLQRLVNILGRPPQVVGIRVGEMAKNTFYMMVRLVQGSIRRFIAPQTMHRLGEKTQALPNLVAACFTENPCPSQFFACLTHQVDGSCKKPVILLKRSHGRYSFRFCEESAAIWTGI
jgi:hypothetical protein